ncbi:hypothetical protein BDA99DRAFT_536285 [Phascolomyces articulosus]|uniref:Uncharacterized protein n=1 Tax=Phascolomyces articulosus TaxID=60185 RepID=A0AAD5K364_9FUNG|nr:hypothetical protein BDA99DRAFT_536285 [Phascolomyces articulosus]
MQSCRYVIPVAHQFYYQVRVHHHFRKNQVQLAVAVVMLPAQCHPVSITTIVPVTTTTQDIVIIYSCPVNDYDDYIRNYKYTCYFYASQNTFIEREFSVGPSNYIQSTITITTASDYFISLENDDVNDNRSLDRSHVDGGYPEKNEHSDNDHLDYWGYNSDCDEKE